MSRSWMVWMSLCCVAAVAFAEDAPKTAFQKGIRIPTNYGFATNISEDGQVAGIIFDNLTAEAQTVTVGGAGTLNQTVLQSKVCTLNLPYTTDQRSVAMFVDVRGFVSQDPGATARLVICAGDTTKSIDLFTEKKEGVKLKGKSKEEAGASKSGDFQQRVEFTVQTRAKKPVCQITLLLVVEHDTDAADAGGGMLGVDSLDVSIGKGGKAAFKD